MPTLEPFDESFFETAPVRFSQTWDVPRSAEDFWPDLVARPLHWCRDLRLEWRSPLPLGIGAKRHMALRGGLRADEHFFIWDEGRRQAFYFTRANLPAFRRFGELYTLVPTGPDSCHFTWTLASEPRLLGKLGSASNRLIMRRLFTQTGRYIAEMSTGRT
jgi:hypothetical protein